jgi:hypothetical protein
VTAAALLLLAGVGSLALRHALINGKTAGDLAKMIPAGAGKPTSAPDGYQLLMVAIGDSSILLIVLSGSKVIDMASHIQV